MSWFLAVVHLQVTHSSAKAGTPVHHVLTTVHKTCACMCGGGGGGEGSTHRVVETRRAGMRMRGGGAATTIAAHVMVITRQARSATLKPKPAARRPGRGSSIHTCWPLVPLKRICRTLLCQSYECLCHCLTESIIQCESLPAPVTAGAQATQLVGDETTIPAAATNTIIPQPCHALCRCRTKLPAGWLQQLQLTLCCFRAYVWICN